MCERPGKKERERKPSILQEWQEDILLLLRLFLDPPTTTGSRSGRPQSRHTVPSSLSPSLLRDLSSPFCLRAELLICYCFPMKNISRKCSIVWCVCVCTQQPPTGFGQRDSTRRKGKEGKESRKLPTLLLALLLLASLVLIRAHAILLSPSSSL